MESIECRNCVFIDGFVFAIEIRSFRGICEILGSTVICEMEVFSLID